MSRGTGPSVRGARGEIVPLRTRLGALQAMRVLLAVIAVVAVTADPATVGAPLRLVTVGSAAYLVLTLAIEVLRQRRGRLPAAVGNGQLLLDAVAIVGLLAASGGPQSPLAFLAAVHLIAVTLLASSRTGLKLALWYSLLLVVAYYAQPVVDPGAGSVASLAVVGFWTVALATAILSAINERELRRGKAEQTATARLAGTLVQAQQPADVAHALLNAVIATFGYPRAALLLEGAPRRGFVATPAGGVTDVSPVTDDATSSRASADLDQPLLLARGASCEDPLLDSALPGARHVVVVPLRAEGRTLAVLAVERGGPASVGISATTVAVISQFAAHAALALRSVELLAEVARLATTDGLTGLANRRTFDQTLDLEVARTRRSGRPLSLVLCDIDHFKAINDTYGHQVGDEVLRHCGGALVGERRETDLAARYGGEELVFLLPDCDAPQALAVAERLRAVIAAGAPVPITASAGVATMPGHAAESTALIAAADAALYTAKDKGRDRAVLAPSSFTTESAA